MNKNHYVYGLLLVSFAVWQMSANPTITFFFEPVHDIEEVHKNLKKPAHLVHHTVYGIMQHSPIAGILVTYGGYIAASTYNGEIVVPRKHQKIFL